jgi:hypothetical protein
MKKGDKAEVTGSGKCASLGILEWLLSDWLVTHVLQDVRTGRSTSVPAGYHRREARKAL